MNKYQKVKSSGLPIWRHHPEIDCKQAHEAHDDALTQEVNERIEKWKQEKEKERNKRTPCPYGCGKSWKSIHAKSVKLHVLEKCPNRAGNEEKLLGFYSRKSRA